MRKVVLSVFLVLAVSACGGSGSPESGSCSEDGNLSTSVSSGGSSDRSSLSSELRVFDQPPEPYDALPTEVAEALESFERTSNALGSPKPGGFDLERSRAIVRDGEEGLVYSVPTENGWVCASEAGDADSVLVPYCWQHLRERIAWVAVSGRCDPAGLAVFGLTDNDVSSVTVVADNEDLPTATGVNGFHAETADEDIASEDVTDFRLLLDDGTDEDVSADG
jgi:hypothetical protein